MGDQEGFHLNPHRDAEQLRFKRGAPATFDAGPSGGKKARAVESAAVTPMMNPVPSLARLALEALPANQRLTEFEYGVAQDVAAYAYRGRPPPGYMNTTQYPTTAAEARHAHRAGTPEPVAKQGFEMRSIEDVADPDDFAQIGRDEVFYRAPGGDYRRNDGSYDMFLRPTEYFLGMFFKGQGPYK
tara:strand:- start:214 stop:768 length:555 start_codon:yes stop_codon:yes gene_type:complete